MSTYIAFALALNMVAGDSPPPNALNVVDEFNAIVESLKRTANNKTNNAPVIAEDADGMFRNLLERAQSKRLDEFSTDELTVLSECCLKTKEPERALVFADKAASLSRDLKPHLLLVRVLCDLNRVSQAEDAAERAEKKYPSADRVYLLHNLIALKWKHKEQLERADVQYEKTVLGLLQVLHKDPFYNIHLRRCIDDLDVIKKQRDNDDLDRCINVWEAMVTSYLATLKARLSNTNEALEEDMRSAGRLYEALLLFQSYSASDRGEELLVEWEKLLATIKSKSGEWWYRECAGFIAVGKISITPSWQCLHMRTALLDLERLIRDVAERDDGRKLRSSLSAALTVVDQHVSMRRMVNKKIIHESVKRDILQGGYECVCVHLTNPTIIQSRRGIESLAFHTRRIGLRSKLGVVIGAPTTEFLKLSGAHIESNGGGDERERIAALFTNAKEQIGSPCHCYMIERRLTEGSDDAVLPLSIVLNREGVVIGTLLGDHPRQLELVFRFALQSK